MEQKKQFKAKEVKNQIHNNKGDFLLNNKYKHLYSYSLI